MNKEAQEYKNIITSVLDEIILAEVQRHDGPVRVGGGPLGRAEGLGRRRCGRGGVRRPVGDRVGEGGAAGQQDHPGSGKGGPPPGRHARRTVARARESTLSPALVTVRSMRTRWSSRSAPTFPRTVTSAPASSSGTTTGRPKRTWYSTRAPGRRSSRSPPGRRAPS